MQVQVYEQVAKKQGRVSRVSIVILTPILTSVHEYSQREPFSATKCNALCSSQRSQFGIAVKATSAVCGKRKRNSNVITQGDSKVQGAVNPFILDSNYSMIRSFYIQNVFHFNAYQLIITSSLLAYFRIYEILYPYIKH